MKHKTLFSLLVVCGVVLAFVASALVVHQTLAQGVEPQAGDAVQAIAVSSAFTYQGYMKKNGTLVTDTCDFKFNLYDAETGGTHIGYSETTENVVDGRFSAQVDPIPPKVDDIVFEGEARWMEVWVRCPANTGSYKQLTNGREDLTAVPYAHSLRPGATVKGATGTTLHVSSSDDDGVAVYGEATSTGTSGEWQSYGGKFVANGNGGVGLYGEDNASGVMSRGYGVWGRSNSVYGIGVLGVTDSVEGYGVYSGGDAHVAGKLTWTTKTSYVSIPAAAFTPEKKGAVPEERDPQYINWGERLINYSAGWSDGVNTFVAPVKLPQGATVQSVRVYHQDGNDPASVILGLYRGGVDPTPYTENMASLQSTGSPSSPQSFMMDDTIDCCAQIDNLTYTYYLAVTLNSDYNLWLNYVVIEYTISEPY